MKARIKHDEKTFSKEFNVEESIRQGSGLSAILYAQHSGKLIEDCEQQNVGTLMGSIHVPAIGWQDDITMMARNQKQEDKIVNVTVNSAKEQKINFSEDKCKYIIIGNKKDDFKDTTFGEKNFKEDRKWKSTGILF